MRTQLRITNLDYQRLNNLIQSVKTTMKDDLHNIETLENEIERAKRIEPRKIGHDVVTMNSEVEVLDIEAQPDDEIQAGLSSGGRFQEQPAVSTLPAGKRPDRLPGG